MDANLSPKQQIVERLRQAERILITTHENPDGDALGSALALQHVLERLGKHVTVGISGQLDQSLSFLNGYPSVVSAVKTEPEFIIVLDETSVKTKNVEVRRLDATHLALVITPENGAIQSNQLKFEPGRYPYDVIVVLDCPKIEMVGRFHNDHLPLFKNVTTLNIDHHLGNTTFAQNTLSDTNAAATAEIMVSLIESLSQAVNQPNLIDQHVATALLTGIMTDTGCFQNSNTTPKSLTVAAQMLASGADHTTIVRQVYKTRPLSQLRLWGKAMAHIKEDKPLRFAWSTLTRADFVSSQSSEEETHGLIDELLKTAAGTDFVVLLTEKRDGLSGSLRSIKPGVDVDSLAKVFGGGGHRQAAGFSIPQGTVAEYEQRIINGLRDQQRIRLNTPAPTPTSAAPATLAASTAIPNKIAPTDEAPLPPETSAPVDTPEPNTIS